MMPHRCLVFNVQLRYQHGVQRPFMGGGLGGNAFLQEREIIGRIALSFLSDSTPGVELISGSANGVKHAKRHLVRFQLLDLNWSLHVLMVISIDSDFFYKHS